MKIFLGGFMANTGFPQNTGERRMVVIRETSSIFRSKDVKESEKNGQG